MPIYVYKCGKCGKEIEEITANTVNLPPVHCTQDMIKIPAASSFCFRTLGGNTVGFSGAHGKVTKGNRRPPTVTEFGGKRKRATVGGKKYA